MAGNDDREAESKRTLDRLAREGDALSSFAARSAQRVHDHVSAADADPDDWIEQWGTRIGRSLGLAIMIALAVWLLFLVLGG